MYKRYSCVAVLLAAFCAAWTHGAGVVNYQGNPNAAITAINTTGVGSLGTITAGSGGTAGTYNAVALTGGSGTGATGELFVSAAGAVVFAIVIDPGTGYAVNDTLSTSSVPGLTGFSVPVATIGIAVSRLSGQTPAFFQVSASGVTATGSNRPYEDLDFRWNCGDASGTETFTNPVTGAAVNANNAQTGPEAVCVYRTQGTGSYTITLTITGRNGATTIATTKTQVVSVTTFDKSGGEFWYDISTTGAETGAGTLGSPYVSLATLNTKLVISNTQHWLKRGMDFSSDTSVELGATLAASISGIRIGAYPSTGAVPIFRLGLTAPTTIKPTFFMANNFGAATPAAKSDIVFSDIIFEQNSTNTANKGSLAVDINCSATTIPLVACSDIYLDNVVARTTGLAAAEIRMQRSSQAEEVTIRRAGWWRGSSLGQIAAPATTDHAGWFGGALDWGFFVGVSWQGATDVPAGSAGLDHHIYPTITYHALFRWNDFGSGPGRNFCINTNGDSHGTQPDPQISSFVLIADNNITGTDRAFDAGNSAGDDHGLWRNFVAQNNGIHNLAAGSAITFSSAKTMTIRDNLVWNVLTPWFNPGAPPTVFSGRIYRNKIYISDGTTGSAGATVIRYSDAGINWTQQQQITDNIIQDQRTVASAVSAIAADQIAAGSLIDRNQYYAPNDTGGAGGVADIWYENTTAKIFTGASSWRAQASGSTLFDTNGCYKDPAWVSPSTGNFTGTSPCP